MYINPKESRWLYMLKSKFCKKYIYSSEQNKKILDDFEKNHNLVGKQGVVSDKYMGWRCNL